jgi:phosphocarrier protein HPr
MTTARSTVDICNERGLHARASAKFVKLASSFDSAIKVTRDGQSVGAGPGCTIEIEADGPDADTAVQSLAELVAGRFDEDR